MKKSIYILLLILTTLAGMCILPALTKKITYTPNDYPFVYYSEILKDLCFVDYKNKQTPLTDGEGKTYTTAEFDSVMPLLNFRQRMVDGTLPDSIDGQEITPPIVMSRSVVYKFTPAKFNTPDLGLYILFESMPKRVGLELPNDVFRMTDKIEFVDNLSNTLDTKKSELFQKELDKKGFQFPAQWVSGNMNPRKKYDEGYFVLDNNAQLFHLKMVNDRPYVSNTTIGDSIDIENFSMYESGDKRFYGFLYSKQGDIYIIGYDEGKYNMQKLDITPIDLENDEILIMGNLLYWTVTVTKADKQEIYALDTKTLTRVQNVEIPRTIGKWDTVSKWMYPAYITVSHPNTDYIYPKVTFTGYYAFIINLILGAVFAIVLPNPRKKRILQFIYIAITGIPGLIALLLLPNFSTKK